MKIDSPGIYRIIEAEYHADPAPQPSLSKSIAHLLLSRSPLHAWLASPRLNPEFKAVNDSKFDFGSVAHDLLLEGKDFKICVIDADDWRTKLARQRRQEAWESGLIPILAKQNVVLTQVVDAAKKAIEQCTDLAGINLAENGNAQESLFWQDASTGIWCRARTDWRDSRGSLILDYKSTRASAHPDSWVRTMLGLGGDLQAAHYLTGNEALGGPATAQFVFICQEVEAPYACSFIGMPPALIELGRQKMNRAIQIWSQCLKSGDWPSYPNRICYPEVPSWAEWQSEQIIEGSDWEKQVDQIMDSGA